MPESDTQILTKGTNGNGDSKVFGVSIRAWLALMAIGAVVMTHVTVSIGVVVDAIIHSDWSKVGTFANIGEPLYSISLTSLAFYFGHKQATASAPKP